MTSIMPLSIDIRVDSERWSAIASAEIIIDRAIRAAGAAAAMQFRPGAEVSVLLTGDDEVRALNREWRNQDKPTNVLSFPACSFEDVPGAMMLGDIVMAFETVEREATADGKSTEDHLTHLAVHGFLHLIGHDHLVDEDAERMENLERVVLADLGLADPYADRS